MYERLRGHYIIIVNEFKFLVFDNDIYFISYMLIKIKILRKMV